LGVFILAVICSLALTPIVEFFIHLGIKLL
jgi:hypothetical protein